MASDVVYASYVTQLNKAVIFLGPHPRVRM